MCIRDSSKGFWITEAILVLNILSGVIFGATGHVGVNTESKLPQATEVWTGFKALTNYSSSISVTILFTIIVITLVPVSYTHLVRTSDFW